MLGVRYFKINVSGKRTLHVAVCSDQKINDRLTPRTSRSSPLTHALLQMNDHVEILRITFGAVVCLNLIVMYAIYNMAKSNTKDGEAEIDVEEKVLGKVDEPKKTKMSVSQYDQKEIVKKWVLAPPLLPLSLLTRAAPSAG